MLNKNVPSELKLCLLLVRTTNKFNWGQWNYPKVGIL